MIYEFLSVDDFIQSFERELIDVLYSYDLLGKFSKDVKKIFIYLFFQKLNDLLKNKNLFLYHKHFLRSDHELLEHYPDDKLNNFINMIAKKTKKLTNRLIFLHKDNKNVPKESHIKNLDGCIVDELILLKTNEINPKKILEFLEEYKLKDLFESFSIHLSS